MGVCAFEGVFFVSVLVYCAVHIHCLDETLPLHSNENKYGKKMWLWSVKTSLLVSNIILSIYIWDVNWIGHLRSPTHSHSNSDFNKNARPDWGVLWPPVNCTFQKPAGPSCSGGMGGHIKKVILFQIQGALNEMRTHLFSHCLVPDSKKEREKKTFIIIYNFAGERINFWQKYYSMKYIPTHHYE